ncbi:MAG: class C sortase [Bifidobacteriaceae bacterium]|nr:class C sortase [Bifidobacteriaceae bacterium]
MITVAIHRIVSGGYMDKEFKRKLKFNIVSMLIVWIGSAALLYPFIADYQAQLVMNIAVSKLDDTVQHTTSQALLKARKAAQEYDDNLFGIPLHDPFSQDAGYVIPKNYNSVLNLNGDGVMAQLLIPEIDVNLPIYHGISEQSLANGVGHVEYTSTPYGGKNRHSFLAAHRGLPNRVLFTDLNKLHKGSMFYIKVLGETHAYKVNNIQVVKPEDFVATRPESGKDLVTLVTCTPYGVNSHRLLVTGQRVAFKQKELQSLQQDYKLTGMRLVYVLMIVLSVILFILSIVRFVRFLRQGKQQI